MMVSNSLCFKFIYLLQCEMQITKDIKKLTEISHLATVVLDWDDAINLKDEYDRKIIEGSEVKGFRKGKAPLQVVAAKIGQDKYYRDMREYIASKALDEALKGEDISPMVSPTYEFADWEEGGKFVFTATIFTEAPDPSEMFLQPELDLPNQQGQERMSEQIHGIPGQMPIIDGKLPPHMAGRDPRPGRPDISMPEPATTNVPEGDLTAPIHSMPKRPDETLQTPEPTPKSDDGEG